MAEYSKTNEQARDRLYQVMEKHIAELHAAIEAYFAADGDDLGNQRRLELEQYITSGAGDRSSVYVHLLRAVHRAYPKPPVQAPEFVSPMPTIVESPEEARAKGLKNYVVVSEGRPGAIPEEWKDKDIKWGGGYVSEIIPTLSDQQNPARLTPDGEVYYRE